MTISVRNGRRVKQAGKTTWLLSFTDVITLMLTFFVLLFSMSSPKQDKWSMATGGLNAAFKSEWGSAGQSGVDISEFNISSIETDDGLDLKYLSSLLINLFKENDAFDGVIVTPMVDRIIVSMPSEIIFAPSQATLSTTGEKAVYSLGTVLKRIGNAIEIYGHTDPRPIQTKEFPSNWELSLARAQSVATKLYSFGYKRHISVQGFADTRYNDLKGDFPDSFKYDIARRIDVVIQQEVSNDDQMVAQ